MTWVGKILSIIGERPDEIQRRLGETLRLIGEDRHRIRERINRIRERINRIRERINRIRERINGVIGTRKPNEEISSVVSGRVFLFVTQAKSKGEEDFIKVISRYGVRPHSVKRLDRMMHDSKALFYALCNSESMFRVGDIISIVRGGGDTSDPQFSPYKDQKACNKLRELATNIGVITVTGIGHSGDAFPVEKAVDFPQETPTDAANRVGALITGQVVL